MKADPRKVFMSVDAVGGVWTYALELARGLASRGMEIDLAVLGPPPSGAQRTMVDGIDGVRAVATGLPLDWTARTEAELDRAAAELKEGAIATGADLVHLNAPGQAGVVPWGLPLVVAAHSCVATWWRSAHDGPLPPDLAWRARRTARGMAIADAIIAPSHSFAHHLAAAYGPERRINVIHNARKPTRLPIAGARDCILTAGRLWDPAKNIEAIDRAAALLGRSIHAAGPTCGPNGEQAKLPNLVLLGALSDAELQALYARAAIFVSMSKYEPFGLSVLEAAQAGAALVLADIATFRELWHGVACFVPADDSAALASAIDRLSHRRRVRDELARRAQARALQYTLQRKLDATLSVYRLARSEHSRGVQARSAA
jgi:glycosyltransferase involved in cell wall biosynthesis